MSHSDFLDDDDNNDDNTNNTNKDKPRMSTFDISRAVAPLVNWETLASGPSGLAVEQTIADHNSAGENSRPRVEQQAVKWSRHQRFGSSIITYSSRFVIKISMRLPHVQWFDVSFSQDNYITPLPVQGSNQVIDFKLQMISRTFLYMDDGGLGKSVSQK